MKAESSPGLEMPTTVAEGSGGTQRASISHTKSPAPETVRKVALNGMKVTMEEAKIAEEALRANKQARNDEAELVKRIEAGADEESSEYETTDDDPSHNVTSERK